MNLMKAAFQYSIKEAHPVLIPKILDHELLEDVSK